MPNSNNISVDGCPLLQKSIIAAGQQTLDTGGGTQVISLPGVKATDLAIVSMVSDDSGTAIVLLTGACTKDTLTIVRTDDGSSADDAVVNFLVLRLNANT